MCSLRYFDWYELCRILIQTRSNLIIELLASDDHLLSLLFKTVKTTLDRVCLLAPMLFLDFLLVSPTWDTHKSKAVIGGANEPWTLRASWKQTSDWLNVRKGMWFGFEQPFMGRSVAWRHSTKKGRRRKLTKNSLWRLFGSLVLLEFCSKRN